MDSTYRAFTKDPNFLKTILPLSDDLNRILGMIFERNPEKRIKIDQLREEIERCSNFSAPPLEPVQCLTPAASEVDFDEAPRQSDPMDMTSNSSEGSSSSIDSDPGFDSNSDSGSDITEPDSEPYEIIDHPQPTPQTTKSRVAAPAPCTPQAYVLPPQEYSHKTWVAPVATKPSQSSQPWNYGYYENHHYDQRYASPVYHVPQYQSFFNPHAYYIPPFFA
jgi:hypothetical protein